MTTLRRLPRLLNAITTFGSNELRVFQSLANYSLQSLNKATLVIVFALVKPKRLFVQIPKQMKRLNIHIRSVQRAFEERPEIFQAVRMDMALCVTDGMVDHSPVVILFKIIIGHKRISADRRTFLDMLSDVAAKLRPA